MDATKAARYRDERNSFNVWLSKKKKKKQTASVSGYQICGIDHYKVLMDKFFLKTAGKNSFEKEPMDVTNK